MTERIGFQGQQHDPVHNKCLIISVLSCPVFREARELLLAQAPVDPRFRQVGLDDLLTKVSGETSFMGLPIACTVASEVLDA